ncbi:hypothetical protein GCM10011332_32590 [Terasakiella brassicae]|uniref:DUF3768 domain-containing protein n=1 Tax=Terasakiella brassicae TaxID=1634917 RepID=A0A917FEK5_9PROT|nr:DUF3768 domain-containing protein [Terasakiella brassicae]GGF76088.1 hypothetical protein GCM10011332_32590 [Terasakiella brassicae]
METENKIARLNDLLRREGVGGRVMMTQGIQALSDTTRKNIFKAIQEFTDFNKDNDPYGEHDFAALTVDGERINFKMDYYDKSLQYASEDPTDPTITERVMTVLLASEY